MSSSTTNFTAVGVSSTLNLGQANVAGVPFQSGTYVITGTFVATLVLQQSLTGGEPFTNLRTFTSTQTILPIYGPGLYRFACTSYTSGTATVVLATADDTILTVYNSDQLVAFSIADSGASSGTTLGAVSSPTSSTLGFFGTTAITKPSGDVATALSALGLVTSPTVTVTSVSDGSFAITNTATPSKALAFSLTGNTASVTLTLAGTSSTSQTLSFPNITGADTIATLGLAQTFSALKTFSAGVTVSAGAVTLPATSIADAALSSNVALKNGNPAFSAGLSSNSTTILDLGTGATGLSTANLDVYGANAGAARLNMATWGSSAGPFIAGYNIGGTRAAPAATPDASSIFSIRAQGYDGSSFTTNRASLLILADGVWSGGNNGTYFRFDQTNNADTGSTEAVRIQNHILSVGILAPTVGNGRIQIESGTTVATGIAWGTDTFLFRSATNTLTTTSIFRPAATAAASKSSVLLDVAPFSGGSATTTKPLMLLEPTGTTSTGWSTAGTLLGINGENAFTGNLFDAQTNGVSMLAIFSDHSVVLGDAVNIVAKTTTGTKIGTQTTQKFGFWNATPVVQPAGANQAALTDSTTGTAGFTLVDVGVVFSQANINNNFASLNRQVNAFRDALIASGLIKGSA